ncbi:MAG: stage V sporulation protein AC [Clostridia bacterium]|nr:stage V sporulation protein AC [Clostridia bacterium]
MAKQQKTQEQIEYQEKVKSREPKSQTFMQCVRAFVSGGIICCIGQLVSDGATVLFKANETEAATITAIVMVFLGALLTGIGIYDKIGAWAGAGSVVPITGFSNSIVSPAMEFKREGLIMGVGSKLFTIAGPVLVYGITASVIIGLLTCLFA